MNTTHLQAKAALLNGEGIDAAWLIAQQDEGLLPTVTKEIWIREMARIIERELQTDQIGRADPIHY